MTKRIRFTKDHDLWLNVRQTVAAKVGHEMTLTNEKADELVGRGVAEHVGEGVEGEQQAVESRPHTKGRRRTVKP